MASEIVSPVVITDTYERRIVAFVDILGWKNAINHRPCDQMKAIVQKNRSSLNIIITLIA